MFQSTRTIIRESHVRWIGLLFAACLTLPLGAAQQGVFSYNNPIGRWVSEHPSKGGIGSWWEFFPDGTLIMQSGAMVTSHIDRSGDTITLPPPAAGGTPAQIKYRIEGDTLHLGAPDGNEVTCTRIGKASSDSDPLLGKWKPNPPAVPSTDPQKAKFEQANANAVYIFSADGTESVRIPFYSREGTWNPKTHTFQLQNDTVVYPYNVSYGVLSLGQPPDGKKSDTYVNDPLL